MNNSLNNLLLIAPFWSREDDWGISVVSLRTLSLLARWLEQGVTPGDIVAHSQHTTNCTDACKPMLVEVD